MHTEMNIPLIAQKWLPIKVNIPQMFKFKKKRKARYVRS